MKRLILLVLVLATMVLATGSALAENGPKIANSPWISTEK